ncbi:hypothetical protein SAMN04489743_2095 [Pseudarthrobacter equi]|uniref:Uncharacterized protein n=1 Tax=Pseudarthrobacter equi TaxID=728066 RepID=A0A1H1YP69_9MICC|nr:hypothetical protein SAMN04489743_2095 [Pseudarthrobacter equi]
MSARAWLGAITGMIVAVFTISYVLELLGMAPNGTETRMVVVLLSAATWAIVRWTSSRRGANPTLDV